MTTMPISNWQELPYEEIWVEDTEFYPGLGLGNGGRDGDPQTPLCLVAVEMRSGRVVSLWQDEFGPVPPYRTDAGVLFVGFTPAEFSFHAALGWPQPACSIDAYVEFRHYTNDGAAKAEDRGKGFYSLDGALQYFCENGIDTAHKDDMRDRILQGPPFSADEHERIQLYCKNDTEALVCLFLHIAPTIRSWPHAIARCNVTWALAQQERRGVPIALPILEQLREDWSALQLDLVCERDRFGLYEVDKKGKPHWRRHLFKALVKRLGWAWPTYDDGSLDETEETFREMAGRYPEAETIRELRYSLSKLRLNELAVGADGRNRTPLWGYGTKTARNAPSTSKFVFGPAKWIRHLITAPPRLVLVHRDFMQQEVRIAAVLSADGALLAACESGDVYLGVAGQLGFLRDSMSPKEVKAVRSLFKTVVLGIQYGLGPRSLAIRAGISMYEACEVLARLRARFYRFEDYAQQVVDRAGLDLEISTQFSWVMQCPPGINPRTVRNFPIQATAAEIMHVACVLAERRGLRIVAPVHDAFMAEGSADCAVDIEIALDRVMRDAAAVVLRGYELPTDKQTILPGGHFIDDRGAEMWETITRLLAKLEAQRA
jgi:DNA polymerase I